MSTELSGFEFRDAQGAFEHRFTTMVDKISEAQTAYNRARFSAREGRNGLLGAARETLAKVAAGNSYRKIEKGIQLSSELRLRPSDGREWPSVTTKFGDGLSGKFIDIKEIGNYFDWNTHASGEGSFTSNDCYCDLDTSKMGGYIRAANLSPDNSDSLIGHVEGGFWFSYTPTRDCRLAVKGMAIQTYSRQFRDLVDEGMPFAPQVSNVRVTQQNFLTVGYFVDGPGSQVYGRAMAEVGPGSSYYGDGDHANEEWGSAYGGRYQASGFPDVDDLVRNGERALEFSYSPTVQVQANTAVNCFIGAKSAIDAHLDDVKATIRQGGSWLLRRLSVWEV